MSWQAIQTVKAQRWLAEIPRKLRVAALTFAGLVCVDLILYGFLVAPSMAQIRAGEKRYWETKRALHRGRTVQEAETLLYRNYGRSPFTEGHAASR